MIRSILKLVKYYLLMIYKIFINYQLLKKLEFHLESSQKSK